jgi:lipopolysaccharide/colanic/teichoic acid biosynthesis glycosyltransferase
MEFQLKIVITGASGYVGQNIIPILKESCEVVLVVGRDVAKLTRMFPDLPNCSIEAIPRHAQDFDALIHLTVLNTTAAEGVAEFYKINADLTAKIANMAALCNIKRFYNISSIQALDAKNLSPYAQSKREAVYRLEGVTGIDVINVYLPFVRGAKWNGKLSFLNRMPLILAKPLQLCFVALKPSVKAENLALFILKPRVRLNAVILTEGQLKNPAYRTVKRGMDLAFALAVIALLWWALLIVWVLVRLGSPGPGIFAQERVGLHGKVFKCYKFRTMQQGTVQAGTHEVSQASVTSLGRFLRRTKLDELPQVWNILRNEISLIGPRPGLPVQSELYQERQERGVFDVKPGISGLAQVNDIDMSDPVKLATWDSKYIALQSLLMDVEICLATVRGNGQGDKTLA